MPVDEQSTEPTVGLPQEQEGFISDAGFAAFSPVGSAWPQRQGVCRGGGIPMASQGLQKVVGRRLLPALGVPGQPSLALEQGTCPGLCMGLAQL